MKQKMIALLAIVSVFCSVSAQRVNETVTLFGKDQLQGFTINIDNYSIDVVDGAMANIFENQYKLKGSKKKGYHVYENQQCSAFGDARYDIYFTTTEIGKKNNKSVQVTLVVSNGNMNCITFTNDPRTSRNIVNFLEKFPRDVESYNTTLRIQSLENELTKLNKERDALIKDSTKVEDKIANMNNTLKETTEKLDKVTNHINELQAEFNKSHDTAVMEEINQASKEQQSLQKSQTNCQKSLLNLRNDLTKIIDKLTKNALTIEKAENELKTLKN